MIGTVFANRYEIVDRLGQGASADVWKARDTHQDRMVALKTFVPGAQTIHVYGEATILTALEGENVLRVYNADTYDDISYIATRIAQLGTTEDLRRVNPRGLVAPAVVSWIRQALVGLGACHDRRLLHRDIKPDNIFLETSEFALLGDFGYAMALDALGGAPAEGTTHTIAPEMWVTGRGTVESDIYSMGVTAYRLLTGHWPFDAASRSEVRDLVVAGKFERIRDRAPHLSRRLADRIERAIALSPADRFRSWREMHEALGQSGLVGRVWRRQPSHAGHDRCWAEVSGLGAPHEVCAIPASGDTFDVEVRHGRGRLRRLPALCSSGVERRRVSTVLKRVFDRL